MSEIIKITGGNVYTPAGVKKGATVIVENGRISQITTDSIEIDGAQTIDAGGLNVVPGGIDLHIHGGGGRDYMEGTPEAFKVAVESHLMHGTTAIYPTLSSSSVQMILDAAHTCEQMMTPQRSN